MSKLQDALISSPDVYAGGTGQLEMPDFDPADEFIPDGIDSGLIDSDDDLGAAPVVAAPVVEETVEEVAAPVVVETAPVVEPETVVETPQPAEETPIRNKQDFLHRLKAKNNKLAERDARIADLEARLAGSPAPAAAPAAAPAVTAELVPDLQARRQQVLELTIDGQTAAAAALQGQIDAELTAAIVAATTKQVLNSVKQESANQSFEDVLADIAVTYPELDETGDAYDTKTARMINAVMAEYMDDDHSRPEALRLATDEVMRMKYPNYFTAPAAEAAPAAVPVVKSTAPVKAAVAKAAAAAAAQPGLPVGSTSPRAVAAAPLDIFSMSDEEFSKLTPAQLAEARGDFV